MKEQKIIAVIGDEQAYTNHIATVLRHEDRSRQFVSVALRHVSPLSLPEAKQG